MDVVLECLALREQRVSVDMVRDEVEAELNKELEVIEGIRVLLSQKVSEGFDQLCILQDVHQMLHTDITDKVSALDIDKDCTDLCNTSATISLHSDPTRIKKGIVTPTTWDNFSTYNTLKAQEEMKASMKLREAMKHTIQQTNNDLETQWKTTNYAFRKRIHEMEEAKSELEWQKKNTEDEIVAMQKEIEGLSQSIAEKLPPMMVAQTRLENRTYRPNVELCRDQPQYNLVDEVGQIRASQQLLTGKRDVSDQALGTLERTLQRINSEIAVKTNSLQLDNQCMKVREKLQQHPNADILIRGDLSQFMPAQDDKQPDDK
ncbi:tektin-B1-like isoform X3 [Dysidea avara]